ncbi:hypothetical protein [Zhihengliuella salsuginis]|uniref:Uncharacterized protein n=1 Tax=Zhihengliuella salsuginis TaxID=578222 RepID=A0ABQ3GBE2_9MICC|nr:hypothetical protein [Zhihengliuella salsuginis]GHC99469.1 hypothetical protein GCM10008096_01650 [Zhihengliuella salsuginis]
MGTKDTQKRESGAGASSAPSFPEPDAARDDAFAVRLLWIFAVAYLPSLVLQAVLTAMRPTQPATAWPLWLSVFAAAMPLAAAAAVLVVSRRFPEFRRTALILTWVMLAGTALSFLTGQTSLILVVQLVAWALLLRHRLVMIGAAVAFAALVIPSIMVSVGMEFPGRLYVMDVFSWLSRVAPPLALGALAVVLDRRDRAGT